MSYFRRYGHIIAAVTASTLVISGTAVAEAQEMQTVSVTNITDFHGHLSEVVDTKKPVNTEMGAARIAGIMNQLGSDDTFAFRTTSGDNVGGSAFVSAISDDKYTLEALNEMGIDVSAAGNHEFDKGQNDLYSRINEASDYPILGANVIDTDTGEPALDPSYVVEKDGLSIGFVGTVTQQTVNKVSPAAISGLEFTDPVAAANAEAARLKAQGVDAVIVLQHEDIAVVNGFSEDVDAAFGGDSHQRHLNGTLAQSQEYGKVVSELEFDYDPARDKATNFRIAQHDYTTSGTVAVDPAVAETVAAAEAEAKVLGEEVVATIDKSYYRGTQLGGATGSNRGVESTLNNMLAESNRRAMNQFLKSEEIDLGIMNAGGVRADLESGEVTYAEALTVQPFGNNLGYATLSGATILQALENQWQPGASRPRLSLGLSDNASYSYDPSAPQGSRVIDARIDGVPIDPSAEYKVAGASFLLEGGDGYINKADVRDYRDVGYPDIAAFTDYLKMEDAPTYRAGQSDIGISGLSALAAGQTSELELTSLSYSNTTEPQAKTVTVHIGDLEFEAQVNNEVTTDDIGLGEVGRATVEVALPETYTGEERIWITTDAGTKITVRGTEPTDPSGSSLGSSVGGILAGLLGLGVVGGIVAAVLNFLFPAQTRQAIENFFPFRR